jgi:hypothetical protein
MEAKDIHKEMLPIWAHISYRTNKNNEQLVDKEGEEKE